MRLSIRALLGVPVALGLVMATAPADAAQQQNAYYYVNWALTAPGATHVDQVLQIRQKAPTTFWAFSTRSLTNLSDGMYLGLQTDGVRFDGTRGEMAIFSVWNATAARGPSCGIFGGEGNGWSCRIPYTIRVERQYRLRLVRQEADSAGQWWAVWVKDLASGADSYVGGIRAPAGTSFLAPNPVNFTEYWGNAVPAINQVPQSVVDWYQPQANPVAADVYAGTGAFLYTSKGSGTTGTYTLTTSGTSLVVRVTMGGNI